MPTSIHPVLPSDIQKELNQIWESLETTNVARACLFNLIFYTQKNHRTAYIERLAQKVVEKFPSRVIFITIDPTKDLDFLKTQVSILSSSKGEFDVACDYIQIQTAGSSTEKIPFVVLPHILPDLPVYLVWAEDPSVADPLSYRLEQFANRLIFDSESTTHLPRFASTILEHYERSGCDIADLNWARIESWREMLSMAFYSDENLKQIKEVKTVCITYNAKETPFFCHTHIQSVYLQAWLACQLNWQLDKIEKKDSSLVFHYHTEKGPITITLSSTECTDLPPGLILAVDIESTDGQSFCFKRDRKILHQITYQHSTKNQCDLPSHYIFTKAESGHSLIKEICHKGSSEHFIKVLQLVKKMDVSTLC